MMAAAEPIFIGVDPGDSGAIAVIDPAGKPVDFIKACETPHDVWAFLANLRDLHDCRLAAIEKVSAMPKQGVSSTFKFGTSAGMLAGFVIAAELRFEFVTPGKWQGALNCRSGGDKNVTKRKAQQLFPRQRITHANADAFLLAEYARRLEASRNGA